MDDVAPSLPGVRVLNRLKISVAASLFPIAGGALEFAAYLVLWPMIWGLLMAILVPFFVISDDHGAGAGFVVAFQFAGVLALPLAPFLGFFWGLKAAIVAGTVMTLTSPFIPSNALHRVAAAIVGGVCSVTLLDFDLDGTSMSSALALSGALSTVIAGGFGRWARCRLKRAVGGRNYVASSNPATN